MQTEALRAASEGWSRDAISHGVVLSEGYAGLEAQALGLGERAGIKMTARSLHAAPPWSVIPARFWPSPLAVAGGLHDLPEGLIFSAGGTGAAVGAALRRRGRRVIQIQNPRMRLDRFDLVVANRHDEIAGANVLLARTALHRVTRQVLENARKEWAGRLSHLPRPLVAVLVGGSNGRFRLAQAEAEALSTKLATMMQADRVGLALSPSRRTGSHVLAVLQSRLMPLGGWIWDMQGDNPYLGMLACADAIVVTSDSVSMISEAAATEAPVMVAQLPGRSRRIGLFIRDLVEVGRIRMFNGRLEHWPVTPIDDTGAIACEVCRRLDLPIPAQL